MPGSVDETSELLSRFGVHHRRLDSGLGVAGCEKPTACTFRAHSAEGAMAACVLALRADGLSRIEGAETLVARFPRFVASMRALGANMEVESQS